MFRPILIALLLLVTASLHSQPSSNLRIKRVLAVTDTLRVDTLSIIPGSAEVFDRANQLIDTSCFRVLCPGALLVVRRRCEALNDSLFIRYRVFPILFTKVYRHRDETLSLSPDSLLGLMPNRFTYSAKGIQPFGDRIEASGSITRGITLGNNQDLVVNSGLNLTLSGELGGGIRVEGAISDRTIPFQPQGNTLKLEEFDRIYIRAFTKGFALQAGDVEIQPITTGLLAFSRSVQGLSLDARHSIFGNDDSTRVRAALSVAKGKFARNAIAGIEGNQGPYRLRGAEGEVFFIVIAGSERVFVDGKQLTRGESNHYTIDYNIGEITFTPLTPITGNSRIVVEFEYSERSYARFIAYSGVEQMVGRAKLTISAFSEGDSRNQPLDQSLTEGQIALLRSIGDRLELALTPQVDSVAFSKDKILYEKKDTTENGIRYVIFRQSADPLRACYQLGFSYMGEGGGNYTIDYTSANGRVYRWVAPASGIPQGNYEPVRVLVTPKKRQLASAIVERRLARSGAITSEVAISRNDLNTFSPIDNADNVGYACRIRVSNRVSTKDTTRKLLLTGEGLFTSSHFAYIDRFRAVEHSRDWNLGGDYTGQRERNLWLELYYRTTRHSITERVEGLMLEGYTGYRNALGWRYASRALRNSLEVSNLVTNSSVASTGFNRGVYTLEKSIGRYVLGINASGEQNILNLKEKERISPLSFQWYRLDAYTGMADSLPCSFNLSYKMRKDWKATDSTMRVFSVAHDVGIRVKLARHENSQLKLYAGYRRYEPLQENPSAGATLKENNVLGRVEYSFKMLKGMVASCMAYELGSGLEPRYQYYYAEVPAGQGVFAWIDYNANGTKELDEFEVASFRDEARYIRINLPSTHYQSVTTNAVNCQMDIRPNAIITDTSFLARTLSRLSDQLSYSSNQKNNFSGFFYAANPVGGPLLDTSVILVSRIFRNSMAYNRFNRRFGAEWVNSMGDNKQVLANGYEIVRNAGNQLITWIGLSNSVSTHLAYLVERKEAQSEMFTARCYRVFRQKPSILIRYSGFSGSVLEMKMEYETAANTLGDESLSGKTYRGEYSTSLRNRYWVSLNSSVAWLHYSGSTATPLGYELLRGFKPGVNATWEIRFRRRLSTYIELEFNYNGRYISTGEVIHNGGMQARAIF